MKCYAMARVKPSHYLYGRMAKNEKDGRCVSESIYRNTD